MSTFQDASIGIATETTYGTYVTPTRWYEFTDESLDWNKNIKQGQGLRSGGRVARSGRRVIPTADGGGDVTLELASKGLGLLFKAMFGNATSTLVSGSTYQQVFTLGDNLPSLTIQKGVPRTDGVLDAYSYTGCTVDSFELDFPNADICSTKVTFDMGQLQTASAYASPSYAAEPVDLFHFAGGAIYSGALTPPSSIAMASAPNQLASVRSGNLSLNHNLDRGRYNLGGGIAAGRKDKPTVGLREISTGLVVEYSGTTFRDAILNDTPMTLVLTYAAAGPAITQGLQIALPEVKFDGKLPTVNKTDLITHDVTGQVLDNLTAAQPIWAVIRTFDTAL